MHELLQSQVATATLYKILLVAEGIQFLWYSIHEDFPFIWKARVADWFQEFVKYFQVNINNLIYEIKKSATTKHLSLYPKLNFHSF